MHYWTQQEFDFIDDFVEQSYRPRSSQEQALLIEYGIDPKKVESNLSAPDLIERFFLSGFNDDALCDYVTLLSDNEPEYFAKEYELEYAKHTNPFFEYTQHSDELEDDMCELDREAFFESQAKHKFNQLPRNARKHIVTSAKVNEGETYAYEKVTAFAQPHAFIAEEVYDKNSGITQTPDGDFRLLISKEQRRDKISYLPDSMQFTIRDHQKSLSNSLFYTDAISYYANELLNAYGVSEQSYRFYVGRFGETAGLLAACANLDLSDYDMYPLQLKPMEIFALKKWGIKAEDALFMQDFLPKVLNLGYSHNMNMWYGGSIAKGSKGHLFFAREKVFKLSRHLEHECNMYGLLSGKEQHVSTIHADYSYGDDPELLILNNMGGADLESLVFEERPHDNMQAVKRKSVSERIIKDVVEQVLTGLLEMRYAGIFAHNDIRPKNIVHDNLERFSIVDLGCATTDDQKVTGVNRRFGGRSDMHSLAQVAYWLKSTHTLFDDARYADLSVFADSFVEKKSFDINQETAKIRAAFEDKDLAAMLCDLTVAENKDLEVVCRKYGIVAEKYEEPDYLPEVAWDFDDVPN